jgi:hypothetical protein
MAIITHLLLLVCILLTSVVSAYYNYWQYQNPAHFHKKPGDCESHFRPSSCKRTGKRCKWDDAEKKCIYASDYYPPVITGKPTSSKAPTSPTTKSPSMKVTKSPSPKPGVTKAPSHKPSVKSPTSKPGVTKAPSSKTPSRKPSVKTG